MYPKERKREEEKKKKKGTFQWKSRHEGEVYHTAVCEDLFLSPTPWDDLFLANPLFTSHV